MLSQIMMKKDRNILVLMVIIALLFLSGSPHITTGQLKESERPVVEVYREASSSVVNIITSKMALDNFRQPVPQGGSGSGFVYDKQGHIITNNHVVEGAQEILVNFTNGKTISASLVGGDPLVDLAVIKVDLPGSELRPLKLGDSTRLQEGQTAVAIGNPFGLDRTITTGVISSLDRIIPATGNRAIFDVIQTDAAINPGNSGGPLLNLQGKVIGVNTAIFSPSGGSVGIGFAVSVNAVKRVAPELIEKGYYPHPRLGLSGISVTPGLIKELEQAGVDLGTNYGFLVTEVATGGPAETAGIKGSTSQVNILDQLFPVGGDIIVAIDGNRIEHYLDLLGYIERETSVGQTVDVTVIRNGSERRVEVEMGGTTGG
ncbi:trypsin-like peptidase domain-containing protein [Candidatus Bipolaricaulota bacterium]|nr:trypsin-like peptidase domain-containing protein [Candidatus Bipolaricaulota bacterium]